MPLTYCILSTYLSSISGSYNLNILGLLRSGWIFDLGEMNIQHNYFLHPLIINVHDIPTAYM